MKLSLFNGGVNIRQNPLLIASNEAVVCENVDTSTGVLKSAKSYEDAGITITNKPFYSNIFGEWQDRADALDYMEYLGKLYWTTSARTYKYNGSDVNFLGIKKPTNEPYIDIGNVISPTPPSGISAALVNYTAEASIQLIAGVPTRIDTYNYGVVFYKDGVVLNKQTLSITNNLANVPELTISITGSGIVADVYLFNVHDPDTVYVGTIRNKVYDLSDLFYFNRNAGEIDARLLKDTQEYTFGASVKDANGLITTPIDDSITMTSDTQWIDITVTAAGTPTIMIWLKYGGKYFLLQESTTTTLTYYFRQAVTDKEVWKQTGITGTVQYLYTYVNENEDLESAPSGLSVEFSVDNAQITVSTLLESSDPQVTHKYVYRIGGDLTAFTYIGKVQNGLGITEYFDQIIASDVDGDVLSSELNDAPPEGLRYLTHVYTTFVGAVDSRFYFARDIGNPNYWPATYYIEFYSEITGIGLTSNNIIVFTKFKSYIITGTNAYTFVPYLLDGHQGCINHDTIVEYNGQLIFMSTDGICITTGSEVKVLSKFKLGKQNLDTINAILYDEVYYCQLSNNLILVFDFRYEPSIRYFNYVSNFVASANDILYARIDNELKQLFVSALDSTYKYTTGLLSEGDISKLKSYGVLYVYAEGTHTIKVYINKILVREYTIDGSKLVYELKVPQSSQQGYNIQFEMEGQGTISEIEYKSQPRLTGD